MASNPYNSSDQLFAPEFEEASEQDGSEGIDLRIIWAMLRRNLVLIGIVVACALALALVATLLAKPRYTATASVQIEQESQRVLDVKDVEPTAGYQDAERFLQTQTDILRSRALAISVAETLKLFGNRRFYEAMGVAPDAGIGNETAGRELTLTLLQRHLEQVLPRNSRIVELSFESADAQLSADIVNTYARNFITGNLQRKYSSSSYARDFLSRQLVEAKERLEVSERALNSYARSAGIIAVRPSGGNAASGQSNTQSVTTASLEQLNEALNTAKAARVAAEQRWRTASSGALMSIPEVLANPAIQDLMQQRSKTSGELNEERSSHLDGHPRVKELTSQVNDLNAQIGRLAGSIRTSLREQYNTALGQERALAAQVGGLKNETLGEQDRSVRLNILAREADTNRTLYDGLLQRFKELSAAAGITANNIFIIDSADVPLSPSSPNLVANLAIGLLVGLLAAVVLVYLREQIDDAVRSPFDIERKLDLPVLGVVPRSTDQEDVIELLDQPRQQVTEAYAALRTALMYATPHGIPKVLLITSAQPAEGKSTSSYALATNIAKLGKRVVLIDADLRRPSMHKLFALSSDRGLSDLLVQHHTLDEVIQHIPNTTLSIVPSGPIAPNPTELLSSGNLPPILATLSDRFDVVLLDGPPVLGLADAPLLSAQVEATLLVIESNRGFRGRTKGAIRRLRIARGHLIGAVLTKFEARKSGVAYEYGYYEYYNYGVDREKKGA